MVVVASFYYSENQRNIIILNEFSEKMSKNVMQLDF